MPIFWVILGGGIGAGLRYIVSGKFYSLMGQTFPWGTLGVNVIGAFLIGIVSELLSHLSAGPSVRMFLLVGLLGGFTTYSSFSLETVNLLRYGEVRLAVMNVLANNLLCILLSLLGILGSRYMFEMLRRMV